MTKTFVEVFTVSNFVNVD